MPTCPEQSVLARFIDGSLDPRRREAVAEHLDHCPVCLEVAATASTTGAGSDSTVALGEPGLAPRPGPLRRSRGDSVGRYVLLDPIGAGGLGEVYAAYDPKLDRKIAIKIGRKSGSAPVDPEQEQRALREAQALARLSHPNVVAVHDVGTVDGQLFIAMEHIEGQTLRDWQRDQDPTWSEVRDVYIAAGQGLAAAHAAGFVHRDFKPSNVMLGPNARVRVLDFGLVRPELAPALTPSAPELSSPPSDGLRTETGRLMGTPAYMAPEQRRGARVDAQADQFSFCLSLWEGLFGQRPDRLPDGQLDLRPPERSHGPPGWLVRALLRGLSLDPTQRFDSMDALLHALRRDRIRKRQWRWVALGAVVSALASATVVMLREPEPTTQVLDRVEQLSQAARDAAARAYFVYPPDDASGPTTAYDYVLELEQLESAGERGHSEAQRLRQQFADTLSRLGDRYWSAEGGRPFSLDYYASALVFWPEHEHARSRAAVTLGELQALRRRAKERDFSAPELAAARALIVLAEEDPSRRAAKIQQLLVAEPPVAHSTRDRLARLLDASPSPAPPEPSAIAVEVDVASTSGSESGSGSDAELDDSGSTDSADTGSPEPASTKDEPRRAAALIASAKAAQRAGRFRQAETMYHQALAVAPGASAAKRGLAALHHEQGHYAKALPFARSAAKARPKDAGLHLLLGDLYVKAMRYPDARAAYERARALGHAKAQARIDKLARRTGSG